MADTITDRMMKFYAQGDRAILMNAAQGHFATSQSHINYYIDVNRIKMRSKEAKEAARFLRTKLVNRVYTVDTIVCLDETEVLGAFLADELERGDFRMTNTHETMYVVKPEENSIHQFMFRQSTRPTIEGKNVLILVDTMTTGETVRQAAECIEYYGGKVCGIASIFSTVNEIAGHNVFTVFNKDDLPGYATYSQAECPYCKKKIPIEAMVNGFGFSRL